MGPSGLEPLTSSLSGTRSNQLSYEPDSHPSVKQQRPKIASLIVGSSPLSLQPKQDSHFRSSGRGDKKTTDYCRRFQVPPNSPSISSHADEYIALPEFTFSKRPPFRRRIVNHNSTGPISCSTVM